MNESFEPQLGQVWGSSSLSRRNRSRHTLQSTSGSVKLARWPEASQMAGGRQDGGVEPDDVVAQLHHRAPPRVLDVAQQEHADRAVVVGRAETAVDLGRREHEATALREVDDLLHQIGVRRSWQIGVRRSWRSACDAAGSRRSTQRVRTWGRSVAATLGPPDRHSTPQRGPTRHNASVQA